MAALSASRLVCSAMPLMVLTMVPITSDCSFSASMPSPAVCICLARLRITSTAWVTTALPRWALWSVCCEVL
ncbi:hypothetical protein D9M73_221760 [compost metagenome]